MKKGITLGIMVLAVAAAAAVIFFMHRDPYPSIQEYVSRHQDELHDAADRLMAQEEVQMPSRVASAQVFEGENTIVQFDVRSPARQYCGFYYSPDDVPAAFQNASAALNEVDDNTWEWRSDGDNHGRTIKISDTWYYFEASL